MSVAIVLKVTLGFFQTFRGNWFKLCQGNQKGDLTQIERRSSEKKLKGIAMNR